jgi:altronate hydrolase
MTPAPVIRLHPDDGVLIARSSLPPGMVVADGVTTAERIPAGHKVAIRAIAVGEPIRRYGQIIGFATAPIVPASTFTRKIAAWAISPRTTRSASM